MAGPFSCLRVGPVTLCRDGFTTVRSEPDDRDRWCFKCRRHAVHTWELRDAPAGTVSYYEPYWTVRCPTCHQDNTAFPGTR